MDDHDWDDPLVHVVNSILTSKSNGRPVLYRLGPARLTVLHQPSGRWIEVEPNAAPAHPRLAPGIVVIGRADNSLIALDLEAAHLVSVHGAYASVWLHSIPTRLRVILVGSTRPSRGLAFETVGDALRFAEAHTTYVRDQLGRHGFDTIIDARRANVLRELTDPIVIAVDSDIATSRELRDIAQLVRQDAGVTAVIGDGDGFSPWRITIDELITVDRTDLAMHPPAPFEAQPQRTSASLAYDSGQRGVDTLTASCSVVVRVLGPVAIVGLPGPVSPRSVEFAAYLALHPEGVTDGQLIEALWPDRAPTRAALNNAASQLRRTLGEGANGRPLFPHSTNGLYRLAPSVTCDLLILETVIATRPHDDAICREAFALIRGRPFTARAGYSWTTLEGFTTRAERAVAAAQDQARSSEGRWLPGSGRADETGVIGRTS